MSERSTPSTSPPAPPRPEGRGQRTGRIASGFRIFSLLTLFSRVLGLVRDAAMAAVFGAGPIMDAFSVAFRIPNLARRVFGEGALTAAFLPVLVREQERSGAEAAARLITAVGFSLGGALLAIVAVCELVLGVVSWLVPLTESAQMLVMLTMQMLPYLVLICLAAQISAVLQTLERFVWPALLPVVMNLVWLVIVVVAARLIPDLVVQIQVVACGVVLAGVCQLGAVAGAAWRAGVRLSRQWSEALPLVREVVSAMLPVMVALSISQINTLIDSLLAWGLSALPAEEAWRQAAGDPRSAVGDAAVGWRLESGTASALYFAQRMYQFPLGVFGTALGTVLFPVLARHVERGELDEVGHDLTLGMRLVAAIGLPASVGLMLLSEPIAVLLFQRGAFSAADAALTAQCIAAYGCGVWATVGLLIIHRGYFAIGDRHTPTRVGLWAVGANFVLNFALIWPLGGPGLALATAVAGMLQLVLVVREFHLRTGLIDWRSLRRACVQSAVATAAMSAACLVALMWLGTDRPADGRGLRVLVPVLAATAGYLAASWAVGLREPFLLLVGRLEHRQ